MGTLGVVLGKHLFCTTIFTMWRGNHQATKLPRTRADLFDSSAVYCRVPVRP